MLKVGSTVYLLVCLLWHPTNALQGFQRVVTKKVCRSPSQNCLQSNHFKHQTCESLNTRHQFRLESDDGEKDNVSSLADQKHIFPFWAGFLVLNLIAVLWGSQHVVIKSAIENLPAASLLNAWRFTLSSLLFLPSLLHAAQRGSSAFPAASELAVYTFLGFAFQAVGLETTTASRSAFLLYLNVKFVPFLAAFLFQKQIPLLTWISALFAFTGTCFLSADGGGLNVGDLWSIAAAVASAMFILRLESFSKQYNAAELNSLSFVSVAFMCWVWVLGDITSGRLFIEASDGILNTLTAPLFDHPWPLIYLGLITTGLCNYLQTIGQRTISAEKAAVIYSMDPVYGAVFSSLVLHEEFGWRGYVGAAFILLGVLINSRTTDTAIKRQEELKPAAEMRDEPSGPQSPSGRVNERLRGSNES